MAEAAGKIKVPVTLLGFPERGGAGIQHPFISVVNIRQNVIFVFLPVCRQQGILGEAEHAEGFRHVTAACQLFRDLLCHITLRSSAQNRQGIYKLCLAVVS